MVSKKAIETKQLKNYDIMDVNAQAVDSVIEQVFFEFTVIPTVQKFIHWAINSVFVLGDWRADSA